MCHDQDSRGIYTSHEAWAAGLKDTNNHYTYLYMYTVYMYSYTVPWTDRGRLVHLIMFMTSSEFCLFDCVIGVCNLTQ